MHAEGDEHEMRDPWTIRHAMRPVVDAYSEAVVDEATVTLTLLRSPLQLGDRLAELHALVSLAAQIDARLPVVIAAARDQGHHWGDIADQLGVTTGAAQRRYRQIKPTIEAR